MRLPTYDSEDTESLGREQSHQMNSWFVECHVEDIHIVYTPLALCLSYVQKITPGV